MICFANEWNTKFKNTRTCFNTMRRLAIKLRHSLRKDRLWINCIFTRFWLIRFIGSSSWNEIKICIKWIQHTNHQCFNYKDSFLFVPIFPITKNSDFWFFSILTNFNNPISKILDDFTTLVIFQETSSHLLRISYDLWKENVLSIEDCK